MYRSLSYTALSDWNYVIITTYRYQLGWKTAREKKYAEQQPTHLLLQGTATKTVAKHKNFYGSFFSVHLKEEQSI